MWTDSDVEYSVINQDLTYVTEQNGKSVPLHYPINLQALMV